MTLLMTTTAAMSRRSEAKDHFEQNDYQMHMKRGRRTLRPDALPKKIEERHSADSNSAPLMKSAYPVLEIRSYDAEGLLDKLFQDSVSSIPKIREPCPQPSSASIVMGVEAAEPMLHYSSTTSVSSANQAVRAPPATVAHPSFEIRSHDAEALLDKLFQERPPVTDSSFAPKIGEPCPLPSSASIVTGGEAAKPILHYSVSTRISTGNQSLTLPPFADCCLLWEFISKLLKDQSYSDCIRWENPADYTFRIVNPAQLSHLWGIQKNRTNMTYEKLSRALRYYYRMDIIEKVPGRRLTYRFLRSPHEIKRGQRGAKHGVPHRCEENEDVEMYTYPDNSIDLSGETMLSHELA